MTAATVTALKPLGADGAGLPDRTELDRVRSIHDRVREIQQNLRERPDSPVAQEQALLLTPERLETAKLWKDVYRRYEQMRGCGVPRGPLWKVTLDGPSITPAVAHARRFLDSADEDDGQAAVFAGPTGTGKTYAATALLVDLETMLGGRGYFIHTPSFARHLLDHEQRDELMERALGSSVVLFDDLGAHHRPRDGAGFVEGLLEEIVWHREARRKVTIVTSNCVPERMADALGDRVASRLLGEWGVVMKCVGSDLRQKRPVA